MMYRHTIQGLVTTLILLANSAVHSQVLDHLFAPPPPLARLPDVAMEFKPTPKQTKCPLGIAKASYYIFSAGDRNAIALGAGQRTEMYCDVTKVFSIVDGGGQAYTDVCPAEAIVLIPIGDYLCEGPHTRERTLDAISKLSSQLDQIRKRVEELERDAKEALALRQ